MSAWRANWLGLRFLPWMSWEGPLITSYCGFRGELFILSVLTSAFSFSSVPSAWWRSCWRWSAGTGTSCETSRCLLFLCGRLPSSPGTNSGLHYPNNTWDLFEESVLLFQDILEHLPHIWVDVHADVESSHLQELEHVEFGCVEVDGLHCFCHFLPVQTQFRQTLVRNLSQLLAKHFVGVFLNHLPQVLPLKSKERIEVFAKSFLELPQWLLSRILELVLHFGLLPENPGVVQVLKRLYLFNYPLLFLFLDLVLEYLQGRNRLQRYDSHLHLNTTHSTLSSSRLFVRSSSSKLLRTDSSVGSSLILFPWRDSFFRCWNLSSRWRYGNKSLMDLA